MLSKKKVVKNIPSRAACWAAAQRRGLDLGHGAERTLDSGRGLQLRTQYATRCSLEPLEPGAACAPGGKLGLVEAAAPEVPAAMRHR